MLQFIQQSNNPRFLVVTPLRLKDKISQETINSISKNSTPFDWISFSGNNNIPTNTSNALLLYKEYEKKNNKTPLKYLIKIDNDIEMSPCLLDQMYLTLKESNEQVAYTYSTFSYVNEQKTPLITFQAKDFDIKHLLLKGNYISSNSMIKIETLEKIGGFICNKKYERLLDYALWLEFLKYGYIGIPSLGSFTAVMSKDSVSAKDNSDYLLKISRVRKDFVNPILKKYGIDFKFK